MSLFLKILEMIGIVSFAISGALTAMRKKLDAFGVVILGMVTAVGGGVLRDVMIGVTPPQCFREPIYLLTAFFASLLFFLPFVRRPLMRRQHIFELSIFLTDSLGLGLFAVSGVQAGLTVSGTFHPILLVFLGMLSGTGGGVLRDVMVNEMPGIFVKHVYALAALAGAVCYLLLIRLRVSNYIAYPLSAAVVVVLRCLAAHYKWNLPAAKD